MILYKKNKHYDILKIIQNFVSAEDRYYLVICQKKLPSPAHQTWISITTYWLAKRGWCEVKCNSFQLTEHHSSPPLRYRQTTKDSVPLHIRIEQVISANMKQKRVYFRQQSYFGRLYKLLFIAIYPYWPLYSFVLNAHILNTHPIFGLLLPLSTQCLPASYCRHFLQYTSYFLFFA